MEGARANHALYGVDDDLFAPYNSKRHDDHESLRRVLEQHCNIALTLHDFCVETDGMLCVRAPELVQLRKGDCLLVVSYAFVQVAPLTQPRALQIDPDSLEFHAIECVEAHTH
jgi:hypothetical protein